MANFLSMHFLTIRVYNMLMKRPRHRVFDYPTRFYKPEDDPKEKQKKKLGFSRTLKHKRKKRSPVIWIMFLILVIYLYIKFGGN